MPERLYRIVLKTGIFISFISVFLVFNGLLFPYITSKQLFFNILIEIIFVFWLPFIIKFPQYRPRKSFITYGLAAFFAAITLSSFFGVDFNLSFWGDVERMLGVFHVLHFFIFYLIIISVFRDLNDWKYLLSVSIGACLLVCLYALLKIAYSTIGNTAYVSGYIIFNFFFVWLLFFIYREKSKDWLTTSLCIIASAIMLAVLNITNTRGAYIGLAASFLMVFLYYVITSKNKKIKIINLSVLILFVAVISLIFTFKNSAAVKNLPYANTILQISSQASTFQTRLISWKAALADFPHHPFFGTGFGNYAITFDKYFDPKFYSYTSSETYFDRAHNNLVDIASTSGAIGLLAYLLVLAAAFYYLIFGYKKNKIEPHNFILLSSLLVAYFIQNLVVFDSLVTYISLMVTLGYIYWLSGRDKQEEQIAAEPTAGFDYREVVLLAITGAIMLAVIFQYNFKVWAMLQGTISGQYAISKGNISAGIDEYKKALGYNTVLDRDSRSSLFNLIIGNPNLFGLASKEKSKEIMDFLVEQAKKNSEYNEKDCLMQLQLAEVLSLAAQVNADDASKFNFYANQALEAINKSIEASPGRITLYYSKGQIYMVRGEKEKAIETFKYAISLNDKFSQSYCQLAKVYYFYKNENDMYGSLDYCLDLGGSGYISQADMLKNAASYYEKNKDLSRLIFLYERWTALEPKNSKLLVQLAKYYGQTGDKDKAKATAEKAKSIDPSLTESADKFIDGLK